MSPFTEVRWAGLGECHCITSDDLSLVGSNRKFMQTLLDRHLPASRGLLQIFSVHTLHGQDDGSHALALFKVSKGWEIVAADGERIITGEGEEYCSSLRNFFAGAYLAKLWCFYNVENRRALVREDTELGHYI